jgi:hypothetical protein
MDPLLVVLRLLHIGGGVLWVGAAWTLFLFVDPTLRALGADTEKSFTQYVTRQRRLDKIIFGATIVTVGAGAILYWIDMQRVGPAWFQTGFGIAISIGAAAGILAFLLGPTAILPTINRLNAIGSRIDASGAPPTAEDLAALHEQSSRLHRIFSVDFVLLVVAVVFMAIARYV